MAKKVIYNLFSLGFLVLMLNIVSSSGIGAVTEMPTATTGSTAIDVKDEATNDNSVNTEPQSAGIGVIPDTKRTYKTPANSNGQAVTYDKQQLTEERKKFRDQLRETRGTRKCALIKDRLQRIITRHTTRQQTMVEKHEKILSVLNKKVAGLKEKGVDTSTIEVDISELTSTFSDLQTKQDELIANLQANEQVTTLCDSPIDESGLTKDAYHSALDKTKTSLEELRTLTHKVKVKIRSEIVPAIRRHLAKLRQDHKKMLIDEKQKANPANLEGRPSRGVVPLVEPTNAPQQ